jgi:hypothetical protein
MSSQQVLNPVPKGTKTVNDMIESQDSSVYQANKELPMRRVSTNKDPATTEKKEEPPIPKMSTNKESVVSEKKEPLPIQKISINKDSPIKEPVVSEKKEPLPKRKISINKDSPINEVKEAPPVRRLGTNKSSRRNLSNSDNSSFHDNVVSDGHKSSKPKTRAKKANKSMARAINTTYSRKHIPKAAPVNLRITYNDFDVNTVNDGLDEIDALLVELENNDPDEGSEENNEFDLEEMMKANRNLRDKIGEISTMVISAISKAAVLKRQIITHRDKPNDPAIGKKNKEINKYQATINK